MKYTKYTFTLAPDTQDFRDVLMAMAGEIGFESFVENEESVDAFIPTASDSSDLMEKLMVGSMFSFSSQQEIPGSELERGVGRIILNHRFPTNKQGAISYEYPQDYEIIINPNMAFGTKPMKLQL